jgi:CBS domain-containing protein
MSEISQPTAGELMTTPVVAVTVDHSVAAAWEAMRERRVHHLVVLDEHGLAGVIDDRTLAAHWPAGGPEARTLHVSGTSSHVECSAFSPISLPPQWLA